MSGNKEDKNPNLLIKRTIYPDSSSLTFGKSYCKYNPLLLKTLIGATVELEKKEKNKDFWIELKTTWLNKYWLKESDLYDNYKNQSAKDDFFNFGYHIGIWDGNFNLTKLAQETWDKYEKNRNSMSDNEKDNDQSLKPFREYFDVFLRNFVVTYNKMSYNPLKSILEKLSEDKNGLQEFILSNKQNLRSFLNDTFHLESDLPLWKCRIFFYLLSSTTYFKFNEDQNQLTLKITKEKLEEELSKCEDTYHDQDVNIIQNNILNYSDKSIYLTKENKYLEDDKKRRQEKKEHSKVINYIELNERYQTIYYGGHKVGKSFILNEKVNNFFEEENYELIYMDETWNFEKLFWQKNDDDVKIGLFLDLLIKAICNPNQNFLVAIEDIDKNSNNLFGVFKNLFERNKSGFSKHPQKISDEKVFKKINEEIKNKTGEYKEDFEELIFEKGIEINEDEIYFPPNFYIWATASNVNEFIFERKFWNLVHVNIDNKEELIKDFEFELKLNSKNNKSSVYWNDFRKIINSFLSNELNLSENNLIGTFFIDLEILKKLDIYDLSKKIINDVLFHLFYYINQFDSWGIFNKEYDYNFSSLETNFSNNGIDIFCSFLQDKLEGGL